MAGNGQGPGRVRGGGHISVARRWWSHKRCAVAVVTQALRGGGGPICVALVGADVRFARGAEITGALRQGGGDTRDARGRW